MQLAAAGALLLLLVACNQNRSPSDDLGGVTPAASSTATKPGPAGSPSTASAGETTVAGVTEFGIPLALQGNWGLSTADCTAGRSNAKGLLRVSATTLTFYESVGRLGTIKDHTASSIRADFAFTGEGMEWSRDITLTAAEGGKTLTRLERGGDEPGGPFTYTKC